MVSGILIAFAVVWFSVAVGTNVATIGEQTSPVRPWLESRGLKGVEQRSAEVAIFVFWPVALAVFVVCGVVALARALFRSEGP